MEIYFLMSKSIVIFRKIIDVHVDEGVYKMFAASYLAHLNNINVKLSKKSLELSFNPIVKNLRKKSIRRCMLLIASVCSIDKS